MALMEITSAQNSLLAMKAKIPFLKNFSNDEILLVTRNVSFHRDLSKEYEIFNDGDYSRSIYFIVRGSVKIEDKQEGSHEYTSIAKLIRHSVFGEMSFITGEPRSARARVAESNTSLLSFDIVDNPSAKEIFLLSNVYLFFARDMAQKIKNTNQRYINIKTESKIPYEELVDVLSKAIDTAQENSSVINIAQEILQEANALLTEVEDEELKKETIKTALIETFRLKDQDIIIMTKNKIVIRLFQEENAKTSKQKTSLKVEVKKDTKKAPTKEEKPQRVKSKDEVFLEGLTQTMEIFSRKVMKEKNDFMARNNLLSLIEDGMNEGEYRKILNFHYLSDYDRFSLINFIRLVADIVWKLINKYVINDLRKGQIYFDSLLESKENQNVILLFSNKIVQTLQKDIARLVARTFIDAIGDLEEPKSENGCIEGAIDGASRHQSILLSPDNLPIATKLQQIWMRTQQAKKVREQSTKSLKEDVEGYEKQSEGFENSIRALYRAKHVQIEDFEDWNHEKIRDVVINENNEYKEQKRLLQYLPIGEITNMLRNKSEKGVVAARSEIGKEEYIRAHKFIDMLHSNNTPKNLDFKLEELYSEKTKKEKLASSMKENLKKEMEKGLEQYDSILLKIFDVVSYNIARTIDKYN